ncbi:Dolichyl-phosphate-mannose-protein mannosyltransferase [bacterium A37T11]|nr:Dolichyl-phosphate-mannose-protein mannosyltransferase [bacterium A37T11]
MIKLRHTGKSLLFTFLGIWLLLNLVQAAFTELHDDEAYYWLYAQFLDWGYFDHPPMVALFIRAGMFFFHAPFTLRLVTVLTDALAIYFLWQIVKPYGVSVRLFILLFSGIVLFHVYGFITTPDSPLFFFSVLFFYAYHRYLKQDSYWLAMLMILIVSGMLYSKYHAVLVLGCCVLANWTILKRPSLWFILVGSFALYLPHIFWQIHNGYPSIHFHIIDRSAKPYKFNYSSDFILGQLLVAGPLTGWFLYYKVFRFKATDPFLRALKVNFFGIMLFFLVSTLKGNVQPHWTLLAFIAFFLLSAIYFKDFSQVPRWFIKLTYLDIALLLLVRLLLLIPLPGLKKLPALKSFNGNQKFAHAIHEKAGDGYTIIDGGFQDASVYDFYNNTTKGMAYDGRDYRKTQFDRWPIEDSLQHKSAYYVRGWSMDMAGQDTIKTSKGTFYGQMLDRVRIYQKLTIRAEGLIKRTTAGAEQAIRLYISNPYRDTINFSNTGAKWPCILEYGYATQAYERGHYAEIGADYKGLVIAPGQTKFIDARIIAPDLPGKYLLIFSVRTDPFVGSRNSDKYTIEVL